MHSKDHFSRFVEKGNVFLDALLSTSMDRADRAARAARAAHWPYEAETSLEADADSKPNELIFGIRVLER